MKCTLFGILALAICGSAWCTDADLSLQQLNHKGWTVAEGAPGAIYAITQTTDGTLWVAGPSGLSRFDGIRFVRHEGTLGLPGQTDITALAAGPDGSLWMGFVLGGVSVLKSTGVFHYGEKEGLPSGTVNNIVMDADGVPHAATSQGLYRFQDGRWQHISVVANDPAARIWAAMADRGGTFWIVTNGHVLARRPGADRFEEVAPRKNPRRVSPKALAADPLGRMWVLNLNQMGAIVRIDGQGEQREGALPEVIHLDTSTNPGMAFDRDGNLWVGGAAVRRFAATALTADMGSALGSMEQFTLADGLTGESVNCFFEDREGNMWVGTYSGLDRFSHSNVIRVGSTHTFGAAVAGDDGAVWVSDVDTGPGPRYPLLEVRKGVVIGKSRAPHFTSAYRAKDGSIWFGGRSGIVQLHGGQFGQRIPLPEREAVQTMIEDRSGAMWVSISRKGLFRYYRGSWSNDGPRHGGPRATPMAAAADSSGRLLFGYRGDRITRIDGSTKETFGKAHGLDVGNVTAIAVRDSNVWIGGDRGIAHFDGARFTPVLSDPGREFTGVSGIVAPANGDLWLNGNVGIVHLARDQLERAIRDPAYRVQPEIFDRLDGLRGYARQVRPSPSAFEGTDGRIWFATQVGLVGIDPKHIKRNPTPPPVTAWAINGRSVQFPTAPLTRFPMHTTNVRIEYTAASLSVPERVRFRYRLQGVDKDWQNAGDRREATYTNLGPGQYVFHVIASNHDGVWNKTGASVAFRIAPAFYQTRWFYGLCVLVGLAFLWVLYQARIRQVSAHLHARLEERLAERERIARELHDTLLQSVQGLVLRFRAAVSRLPQGEPARSPLENALERADGVLAEARDRVKQLRTSSDPDLDISQAIAAWAEELVTPQTAAFRSTVVGIPRAVHPIVREEALYIAREALTNAFRHAEARQIEAEVSYGASEVQIRVRDDGRGIDGDVLRAGGKEGHWGLLGMRERARKVRGTLTVWSKPNAGTEVDLRLPAHVAYESEKRVSRRENLASSLS
jgi:signal transduction histidine kinase/ligand-binding sensor domain-containing protein